MEVSSEGILFSLGRVEEEVSELYFNFPAYKLVLHLLIPLAHFVEDLFFAQFHLLSNLGKFGGKTSLTFCLYLFPYVDRIAYPHFLISLTAKNKNL